MKHQTDCEKLYEIGERDLMEEILLSIRDDFCCTMVQEGANALLTFENGQRFLLSVGTVK